MNDTAALSWLERISREERVALAIGGIAAVLHVATASGYGWFRDEMYYVACGEHLAFGYVDHPPFVALIARIVRGATSSLSIGAGSPVPLRVVAALVGGGTVALTGRLAQKLGAGSFGVALAALCALVAPLVLSIDGFFSMNVFDLFFWALAASVVVAILREGSTTKRWVALGAVVGVGLENKLSIGFFAAGLGLGLLLSPSRALLRTRGPWLGVAVALALWAPNLAWQAASGWMNVEFMNHARLTKNVALSPGSFLAQQVLQMHPITAPVWATGLFALLFGARLSALRPLGVAYLFTLVVFMTSRGKPYYVGPAYAFLFAAGAVTLESWLRATWARGVALAGIVAAGAVTAPVVVPLLPPETLVRYQSALGLTPSSDEKGGSAPLEQRFADQFGWDSLVGAVARAREMLPADERADIGIFARNYGEAGAIDVLGPRVGLPHAMSGHNNYWLWGPKGRPRGPFLVIGGEADELRRFCGVVTPLRHRSCRFCMPYESELTIFVCREPKSPLPEAWGAMKHFD